jgi:hypothetical protein
MQQLSIASGEYVLTEKSTGLAQNQGMPLKPE